MTSMNSDSLRTSDAIITLARKLQTHNIDFVCIRETHNERIEAEITGRYTISTDDMALLSQVNFTEKDNNYPQVR